MLRGHINRHGQLHCESVFSGITLFTVSSFGFSRSPEMFENSGTLSFVCSLKAAVKAGMGILEQVKSEAGRKCAKNT